MAESAELLEALKREMRRQRRTYAEAARALGVSEATVKRNFSEGSFSLPRLEQLLDWLGLALSDLIRLMERDQSRVEQLSAEQEQTLVSDTRLLILLHSLLNGWTVDEVLATYDIARLHCTRLLAQLDRMGIVDVLPGDRVRLKVARHFHWRANGPIQRFFEREIQDDFFRSRFDRDGDARLFLSGMLSEKSAAEIRDRMDRLAREFNALKRQDERLPLAERHGTGMVLAIRDWEPQLFQALRREPG